MSENRNNKKEYRVWLISSGEKVYINDSALETNNVCHNEFTISANSMQELIHTISNEWAILCNESNLYPLYSYSYNDRDVEYFALNIGIDQEMEEIIMSKSDGKFVNLNDFEDYLGEYEINESIKEDFVTLKTTIQNVNA